MKYFVMGRDRRADHFMNGKPNPIYTQVFPDADFAAQGYWFWLKSPKAHGFDAKSFDEKYVYMRSTELVWKDNTSFKRFEHDLPIAERCIAEGRPGPEIKVSNARFNYFSSCRRYKSSSVGYGCKRPRCTSRHGSWRKYWKALDADPSLSLQLRPGFENCKDEEQFYLGNGYRLWQWKHFRAGAQVNSVTMNMLQEGRQEATLRCEESYR